MIASPPKLPHKIVKINKNTPSVCVFLKKKKKKKQKKRVPQYKAFF
jgi:hypothetical protein